MKTRIEYELNRTYLVIETTGKRSPEDYQFRMITENSITCLLQMELRVINGDLFIYYDISEKESLLHYLTLKSANYNLVYELYESLFRASCEISRFLLDERSVLLKPELIFRDIKSGKFVFVYDPDIDEGSMIDLLQFIMTHMNNDDTRAVRCIYGIYDMVGSGDLLIKSAYEYILEQGQEESDSPVMDDIIQRSSESTDNDKEDYCVSEDNEKVIYRPSLREAAALLLVLIGIIIVYIAER